MQHTKLARLGAEVKSIGYGLKDVFTRRWTALIIAAAILIGWWYGLRITMIKSVEVISRFATGEVTLIAPDTPVGSLTIQQLITIEIAIFLACLIGLFVIWLIVQMIAPVSMSVWAVIFAAKKGSDLVQTAKRAESVLDDDDLRLAQKLLERLMGNDG